MSKLMPNGHVYGVDHIKELVDISYSNVEKSNQTMVDDGIIVFKNIDGREGLKEYAPYDCIHIGGAVKEIPRKIMNQLAVGGRLVTPHSLSTSL